MPPELVDENLVITEARTHFQRQRKQEGIGSCRCSSGVVQVRPGALRSGTRVRSRGAECKGHRRSGGDLAFAQL